MLRLTQVTSEGSDSMATILLSIALVISGCVYSQPYPEEWGKKETFNIAGVYSNKGDIDKKSKQLGYKSYPLHKVFWDRPNFDPDKVEIVQNNKKLRVIAFKSGQIVATETFAYNPGEFTVKRSGTDNGAMYHDQYRFWKTNHGLVVESDSSGVTFFILPLAGGDKTWLLFPEIK